jgi:ribosomal protein S21
VQVLVRDNNVDQALRALKKKMQREGVFREMKLEIAARGSSLKLLQKHPGMDQGASRVLTLAMTLRGFSFFWRRQW